MTIWVDADSCPRQIRAIIMKAAARVKTVAVFVADRNLSECTGKYIRMQVVEPGMDSADSWIVEQVYSGDLCISRDIILASRLVEKGSIVIDDRGAKYTPENIAERLSVRNLMTEFREAGIFSERNRPMSSRHVQSFANMFDKELSAALRASES